MRGATKEIIQDSFVKCSSFFEDGKKFDLFYNPNEKEASKAYYKKEAE